MDYSHITLAEAPLHEFCPGIGPNRHQLPAISYRTTPEMQHERRCGTVMRFLR